MSTPDPLTTEWVPMWSTFGLQIQDEGVIATSRSVLNFVGAGVTLTDDTVNKRTVITVPGGAPQTPWVSNIEAATFQLNNCPMISFIGSSGVSSIGATANQLTLSANWANQALVASANQLVWFSSQNAAVQFSGATSILFYTGVSSAERMRINATGVGIGTNNPLAMLDVNGMIRSTGYVAPTAGAGLELLYTNNSGYLIAYNRSTSAYLPLNIVAQSMMIDGQGSAVTFAGNTLLNGGVQYLIDTNHGIKAVAGSGVTLFTFGISSGVFLQQTTGNVCVGGTNPNYRLDCRGSMGFQTAIYGNDKEVFQTVDSYLRLNQSGQFSSGIWFGPSNLKMNTGHLWVGTDGRDGGCIEISATAADSVSRIMINGNSGARCLFNTGGGLGVNTASGSDPLTVLQAGGGTVIRMAINAWGVHHYVDSANYYMLLTNQNDPYGGFNGLRPFYINLSNGGVTMAHNVTVGAGLSVTGNCNITGQYLVNGAAIPAPFHYHLYVGFSGGEFTLQTQQQDIPGLTFTAAYAGWYLVLATLHFYGTADGSNLARCYLVYGGSQHVVGFEYGPGSGTGSEGTISAHWHVFCNANAVLKIIGQRLGGSNVRVSPLSNFSAVWIGG